MAVLSFRRKLIILGACIAVLAGTYILGLVFSPERVGRREAEVPLIAGFNRQIRDRVAEIRLSTDQGSLRIIKREDSWFLPGGDQEYPASATKVEAFLDFIADLTRTRIVTENPDAWEEFQVQKEAESRIQLLDSAGNELTEIIVGKPEVGGGTDHVRLGGSNEIVLSNRSFDYYLNAAERFWSYLRIFPEDLEGQSIMRITVDSTLRFEDADAGPLKYTLVLSSGQPAVWKLVDRPDVELDNNDVDQLAGNLADLEGTEFAHEVGEEETGLADPAARILISTVDDRDFRLLVGAQAGEDQYYVTVENGHFVYKVSGWRVKGILKGIEELRAEGGTQEQ